MICGIDEVGRGCIFGPVLSAAVIFKGSPNFLNALDDSKKLNKTKREYLSSLILENSYYAFAEVSHKIIDEINIHYASLLAMQTAYEKLNIYCDLVLIDGKFIPKIKAKKVQAIIKGDSTINEIKAASIIAKVQRDKLMDEYDKVYPLYELKKNKGYPTKEHKNAIKKYGISSFHRKSFKLI
ncbi:ribonuclease HII [Borrelia coriaceae]|uniref:Ribonuclease HII n=1 Tax=Borrelia coriaceae ATCC 43381 TaxID=1408429 RepID=W5SYP1_9SPIR|nr:ribonuclease HII [Borrelia coriaceae]AHH10201.1 Ribonuclease HII [Borrelia coriaceae ATCC 43381]UPA15926.1 ribonuclease HII [Borrelia coriaceae]